MKLTKDQKSKLAADLVYKRWATIIDEDIKTDSLQEDVANSLGLKLNDVPADAHEYVDRVRVAVKTWLKRLPEVK